MQVDVSMRIVLVVQNGSILPLIKAFACLWLHFSFCACLLHGFVAADSFPRASTNWPGL